MLQNLREPKIQAAAPIETFPPSWLACWLAGWLAGWLGWLGWLAGWLAVWLSGWLAGLAGYWLDAWKLETLFLNPHTLDALKGSAD